MYKIYFLIAVLLLGISNFLSRIALVKVNSLYYQIITATIGVIAIPFYCSILIHSHATNQINFNDGLIIVIATVIALTASQIIAHTIHNSNGNIMNVNIWIALYPVVSYMLSVIFLHENFSNYKLIGILLMVAGAMIVGLT